MSTSNGKLGASCVYPGHTANILVSDGPVHASQDAAAEGEDGSPAEGTADAAAAAQQSGDRPPVGPGALVPAMRTVVSDLAHALCTQVWARPSPVVSGPCPACEATVGSPPPPRCLLLCIASHLDRRFLWLSVAYSACPFVERGAMRTDSIQHESCGSRVGGCL